MTTEYEMTLFDYIDILKRRVILMLSVFVTVTVITFILAIFLPAIYQSTGMVLIESQQISSNFISTSTTAAVRERIEVVKQRVMTRENISRIIKKYSLYSNDSKQYISSNIVDEFRNNVEVEILNTGGSRRGRTTYAFNISFEYPHASRAYKVTNDLVTLFLDQNVKSRVARATETTEFLAKESKRLKVELEKVENIVAAYKKENADALPEHLKLHVEMLQRTEVTLANLDRDYKAAENEKRQIELQLTAVESGTDIGESLSSQLERLKTEYQQANVLYKTSHPTVKLLKRKIEALEKGAEIDSDADIKVTNINSSYVAKLKRLIESIENRLALMNEQKKPLHKRITALEKQIIKTPQVELGLTSMLRDYSSAKKKYEEIQLKRLGAQVAENLEGDNKAGRFILIEPPQLADKPIKPNRFKIILIGLFMALGAAVGMAILLEMMNMRIRGKGALTATLGHAPLVEIPYIKTNTEHIERKDMIIKLAVGMTVLIILSGILVHFFYMPLDLLFYKILSRLG